MKFTLTFDAITYVDLVDNEEIRYFIKFNGKSHHVYVYENIDDNIEPIRDDTKEEQYV